MDKLNRIINWAKELNKSVFNINLQIEFKSHHKKPFFDYHKRKYYNDGNDFYLAPNKSYQNSNVWSDPVYPLNYNKDLSIANPFNTIDRPLF